MKIEIRQDDVVFHAENKWEQDALDTVESRGVSRIQFEDPWDNSGGLRLIRNKGPFETKEIQ